MPVARVLASCGVSDVVNGRARLIPCSQIWFNHESMAAIAFEDGLELLREHDIRVVDARVFDSAEDAIRFAARRAIDLCVLGSKAELTSEDTASDLRTTSSI